MNWGHKITLVIIAFILGMLGMVFLASKQTNEMFDENYYEKELKYQELIDASARLKAAGSDSIFIQDASALTIHIPAPLYSNITNGTVELLMYNDEKSDVRQVLQPDSLGRQIISKSILQKGRYKTRLRWENNDTLYYTEQNIQVY